MSTAEKISHLKLLIGASTAPSTRDYWAAPQLENGIARGIIVELLGSAKTDWLICFLAQHPEFKIFWAEREQSILPTALHQRGLNLNQITFGTFGKNLVQPLRRIIQSQSFEVIIAPNAFEEIKIFQAFQLFTEKSNSTLFLLGDKEPSNAWPISTQLEIHRARPSLTSASAGADFEIEIIKQRHGQ